VRQIELVGRTSFVNPEHLLKSYYRGTRFIEVPIRVIKRHLGVAKGTKIKTVMRPLADTARNWIAWGMNYRLKRQHPSAI
jgi:hypothetical protein